MSFSYNVQELIRGFAKLALVSILGYCYMKWPFYQYGTYWWFFWLWLAGLLILALLFKELAIQIGNRVRGREAELEVEMELKNLPEGFTTLSGLIIEKKGNVDEVVVGPTGIWVVEVKSHAGTITYDGNELRKNGELFEKDFIKQAWAEAYSVRDILKTELKHEFTVQPVILFSDPNVKLKFGVKQIKGVYVIGYSWLNNLIKNNTLEHLDQALIENIVSILEVFQEGSAKFISKR